MKLKARQVTTRVWFGRGRQKDYFDTTKTFVEVWSDECVVAGMSVCRLQQKIVDIIVDAFRRAYAEDTNLRPYRVVYSSFETLKNEIALELDFINNGKQELMSIRAIDTFLRASYNITYASAINRYLCLLSLLISELQKDKFDKAEPWGDSDLLNMLYRWSYFFCRDGRCAVIIE